MQDNTATENDHVRSQILPPEVETAIFEATELSLNGRDITDLSTQEISTLAYQLIHSAENDSDNADDNKEMFAHVVANLLKMIIFYKNKSQTDRLTGLFNKEALYKYIADEVSELKHEGNSKRREAKKPASLVVIDLDKFKPINDVFGHAVGDQALKSVSKTLTDNCRKNDKIARLGGDEFGVLFTNVNEENAQTCVKKLRDAFDNLTITVSANDNINLSPEAKKILDFGSDIENVKAGDLTQEQYQKLNLSTYQSGDSLQISVNASLGSAMITSQSTPETVDQEADVLMYKNKTRNSAQPTF